MTSETIPVKFERRIFFFNFQLKERANIDFYESFQGNAEPQEHIIQQAGWIMTKICTDFKAWRSFARCIPIGPNMAQIFRFAGMSVNLCQESRLTADYVVFGGARTTVVDTSSTLVKHPGAVIGAHKLGP